jgi:anthranilate phosphoribosyltransferase
MTGRNVDISAAAFSKLGFRKGLVVSSTQDDVMFIDELSPMKRNLIASFGEGWESKTKILDPREIFGCPLADPAEISPAETINEQKDIFIKNLRGQGSAAHQGMIAINAAVILLESGIENDPRKAFQAAMEVLRSGAAEEKLFSFCETTREGLSVLPSRLQLGTQYQNPVSCGAAI